MPPTPAGVFPYLLWDMSSMRPAEWWETVALDWYDAQAVRHAHQQGIQDARDDMEAARELARSEVTQ